MAAKSFFNVLLGWSLRVASISAGDSLPRLDGQSSELWRNRVALVERYQPDIVVIANAWMSKLTPERDRLALALDILSPYVGHIILLNQPPILPEEASRDSIRSGTHPQFREGLDVRTARRRTNSFIERLEDQKVIIVDIASGFVDRLGNLRLTDEAGKQLFHDAGHLSGYGAARIRDKLDAVLQRSLVALLFHM